MLTCTNINAGQAKSYYEPELSYYTKNQTNYDRWHGVLAKQYGLVGECSKTQLDNMLAEIAKQGRKDAGFDFTFSAPKSVSLAMAKDEATKADMIDAHQKAVARIMDKIEQEIIQTRSNGERSFSRNMCAAEFVHFTSRPTKTNDYIPDLQLHSHCVVLNTTVLDGKNLAVDMDKIRKNGGIVKEYGLMYRQELARELQDRGYVLEVTDAQKGFFELAGTDREIVEHYSSRRSEILKTAKEHGMTDLLKANQFSRETKSKARADFDEICQAVKHDIYDSKIVEIEKESVEHVRPDYSQTVAEIKRAYADRSRESDRLLSARFSDNTISVENSTGELKRFETGYSLQDLSGQQLDFNQKRINVLLPAPALSDLAKLQSIEARNTYLRRSQERERNARNAERAERVSKTADDVIKQLSNQKFAFTPVEARRRIMAAGVIDHITPDEAKTLMEKAGLVQLGQLERNGKKTRDRYLTTEQNLQRAKAIVDVAERGKGKVKTGLLTIEQSRAALARVEKAHNAEFSIVGGEQAEAINHVLTSNDRYIAIQGLAGTGKTTAMQRLKWVADEQNIEVKGVCFTGKAADGLQQESGIQSTTIHSFLNQLEKGNADKERQAGRARVRSLVSNAEAKMINRDNIHSQDNQKGIKQEWNFSNVKPAARREIWIVDEAGLVDNNLMYQLQRAAEARGAQVVLSGDVDQLPPVGAGQPMKSMIDDAHIGTAYLSDIRRQKDNKELLAAVRESVSGDHLKTFEALDKSGDYKQIKSADKRTAYIVETMTKSPVADYKDNLLLATTNADKAKYNDAIRAEYVKRGELEKGAEYEITNGDKTEHRNFAQHDRIIFTANDGKIGVKNGTLAVIDKIDERGKVTAITDAGKSVIWNMHDYNSIDHAYAVTSYKAQGMSVGHTVTNENGQKEYRGFVLAEMNTNGAAQTRNALYVDISRAKTHAIVVTDDKQRLERQTRNFAHKVTSKDFAKRIGELGRTGIQNNDRYRSPSDDLERAYQQTLRQIAKHDAPPPPPVVVRVKEAQRAEAERLEALAAEKSALEKEKAKLEQARTGQANRTTMVKTTTVEKDTSRGFGR